MQPDRRNATVTGLWIGLTFIGLLAGAPARAAALPPFAGKIMLMAGPAGTDRLSEGNLQTEDRRVARDRRNTSIGSAQRATETRILVRVSWSHGDDQAADSNPFAHVGNRSGLVSVTQAEVRDGRSGSRTTAPSRARKMADSTGRPPRECQESDPGAAF
jgi:hypothetical protein